MCYSLENSGSVNTRAVIFNLSPRQTAKETICDGQPEMNSLTYFTTTNSRHTARIALISRAGTKR